MIVTIDIGNSQTKLGFFKNDVLFKTERFISDDDFSKVFGRIKTSNKKIDVCIVSSVKDCKEFLSKLKELLPTVILNYKLKVPFKNLYKTPKTLGNDRIANAAAACTVYPSMNVLIIDAGTCIKFDLVDSKGNYHGGSISPGIQMRLNALHQFTGKLPFISNRPFKKLVGATTEESILSGVRNGALAEVEGMISNYKLQYKNLIIILTGGDLRFFGNHLKTNIFALPNFTLVGLHAILKLNR